MRISLNWLRDYLDIKPDVDITQISNSLTLVGLEVEGIDELAKKTEGLGLALVLAVEPEEDGEHCEYSLELNSQKIKVRGASSNSVSPGMWLLLKTQGSARKIMSFADLGLQALASDLIAIEPEYFEGEEPKVERIKAFDDVIFSLGITPNRADALSHLGVSRELSAILDLNPRVPMLSPTEMAGPIHEKVAIEIENDDDSPRYCCRLLENVAVGPSPFWLRMRLYSVGLRPINNVVDVTNYVMMSRGQPLHAFDFDKLHKENSRVKIIVRRAYEQEKLKILNGAEITLDENDIVVADNSEALALAGIMGGMNSAVSTSTCTVLLESAYFDPKMIRMSARRHNLSSESSYRFERGVDPNGAIDALNFAARILTEISGAKVCREAIDAYRKRIDPQEIMMRPERAQAVLGMDTADFDQDLLRRRFLRLGIETVAKRGEAIYFRVPTHRADLSREIDLIEEAARMIGYDKVKESRLGAAGTMAPFADLKLISLGDKLRAHFKSRAFFEAVNYAFLAESFQAHFVSTDLLAKQIAIKNPLSERYGVMRLSLVPGLMRNLIHNQRNQEKSVQLFEIGNVFLGLNEQGQKPTPALLEGELKKDSFAVERLKIAGVCAGQSSYFAFDRPERPFDFYDLKGFISEMFLALGLSDQFPHARLHYEPEDELVYLHPGESLRAYGIDGQGAKIYLGSFGKLHPQVLALTEANKDSFCFEFDLESMVALMAPEQRFKAYSRFPTIERDVALLVDEELRVGDILALANELPESFGQLLSMRIFDIYRGKNLGPGKKSVALSMALQRDDRTLTDEEADQFVNDFVNVVSARLGAQRR